MTQNNRINTGKPIATDGVVIVFYKGEHPWRCVLPGEAPIESPAFDEARREFINVKNSPQRLKNLVASRLQEEEPFALTRDHLMRLSRSRNTHIKQFMQTMTPGLKVKTGLKSPRPIMITIGNTQNDASEKPAVPRRIRKQMRRQRAPK